MVNHDITVETAAKCGNMNHCGYTTWWYKGTSIVLRF